MILCLFFRDEDYKKFFEKVIIDKNGRIRRKVMFGDEDYVD